MDIGIGLPNAVRGVERDGIVDWARRAEAAGFSSLGTIDRIAYPSFESMIALGAAAAVTERIGLVTDILIAPLRSNAALLAKQAATIDRLSRGRLVLGLSPGGREDDFEASGVDFAGRGRAFDRQLEQLAAFWRGEGGVGPAPYREGGPPVLIGGYSEIALRRTVRAGVGWTMGGGAPDGFVAMKDRLRELWTEAGRDGEPRTMALCYFALGPDAESHAQRSLGDYYAWLGEHAQGVVDSAAKDAGTVRAYVEAFREAGVDELICFPASADPGQVDLLAEAALG